MTFRTNGILEFLVETELAEIKIFTLIAFEADSPNRVTLTAVAGVIFMQYIFISLIIKLKEVLASMSDPACTSNRVFHINQIVAIVAYQPDSGHL